MKLFQNWCVHQIIFENFDYCHKKINFIDKFCDEFSNFVAQKVYKLSLNLQEKCLHFLHDKSTLLNF